MAGEWVDEGTSPAHEFLVDLLERQREGFEAGDGYMLMAAIRACAEHGLPMPQWAADAYAAAFDRIHRAEVRSWDEVLGAPFPKSANLNTERNKRNRLAVKVWNRAHEILASEPDAVIDASLFERVGAEFHVGKTRASELFYTHKKRRKILLDGWFKSE